MQGTAKWTVCSRLVDDWANLADHFQIPLPDRRRFPVGREPQGVWEWLEQRRRLWELVEGLTAIGRHDLAAELQENPS